MLYVTTKALEVVLPRDIPKSEEVYSFAHAAAEDQITTNNATFPNTPFSKRFPTWRPIRKHAGS